MIEDFWTSTIFGALQKALKELEDELQKFKSEVFFMIL